METPLLGPALALLAIIGLAGCQPSTHAAGGGSSRDALWRIVGGQCAPDQATNALPAPCLAVNPDGDAVLKDKHGATEMLLIATTKVTGIESPAILAPGAPNYFQDAWAAQSFVDKLAGQTIPRQDLGLAINSEDGRSQDQLHIHVDCVMPDVKQALTAHLSQIGDKWAPLAVDLEGHRYEAMRLAGADLAANNPFLLLANGDAAAKADMGLETIVVVGETFPAGPGFVLLADRADPASGDMGSGEALLDHDCQVLKAAS